MLFQPFMVWQKAKCFFLNSICPLEIYDRLWIIYDHARFTIRQVFLVLSFNLNLWHHRGLFISLIGIKPVQISRQTWITFQEFTMYQILWRWIYYLVFPVKSILIIYSSHFVMSWETGVCQKYFEIPRIYQQGSLSRRW